MTKKVASFFRGEGPPHFFLNRGPAEGKSGPAPRTTKIGPQFSGDLFSRRRRVVVTSALNFLATFSGDLFGGHLTEQQRSYTYTRPENFYYT